MLRLQIKTATAVVGTLFLLACSKPAVQDAPERAVRTLVVSESSGTLASEFAGEVKARTEARLGFRVSGKVAQRLVNLGEPVKAGQTLAVLDPIDLQLGQASAQAALVAAKANLDQAEADFKRFRELRAQGFISSAEFDRRQAALTATQSQYEQAKAQASLQQNQAGYARLVSDVAGVVTGVDAEVGTVLAAGSPVIRVAQDGPRDIWFAVPEDQVELFRALLAQGGKSKPLRVRVWGSDQDFPATVREVSAAADPVSRTFTVKAAVEGGASTGIRLGQTARVWVDRPAKTGLIHLPLAAVSAQQGRSVVWLLDSRSMTVQPQVVEIAGAQGNEVLVRSGLAAGQIVVTAGVHVLTPGQKVKQYAEPRHRSNSMTSAATSLGARSAASSPAASAALSR